MFLSLNIIGLKFSLKATSNLKKEFPKATHSHMTKFLKDAAKQHFKKNPINCQTPIPVVTMGFQKPFHDNPSVFGEIETIVKVFIEACKIVLNIS